MMSDKTKPTGCKPGECQVMPCCGFEYSPPCAKPTVSTGQTPIIDADELQKKQSAPYRFHGMTIQEVPIGNPVQVTVFRKAKRLLKERGDSVHRRSE